MYFVVSTALIEHFQYQNWAPRVASKKTHFFPKNTISDILTKCLGVVCEQIGHKLGTPEASIGHQSGVFCRLLSPYLFILANGWKIDKKIENDSSNFTIFIPVEIYQKMLLKCEVSGNSITKIQFM